MSIYYDIVSFTHAPLPASYSLAHSILTGGTNKDAYCMEYDLVPHMTKLFSEQGGFMCVIFSFFWIGSED